MTRISSAVAAQGASASTTYIATLLYVARVECISSPLSLVLSSSLGQIVDVFFVFVWIIVIRLKINTRHTSINE